MYCSSCGNEIAAAFRYCPHCGTATGAQVSPSSVVAERLPRAVRSRTDRKIAGVCAGLARYLGIDVTLLRILMVVFTIWPLGAGLLFYIVCWIVMPNEPLLLPSAQDNARLSNTNLIPG